MNNIRVTIGFFCLLIILPPVFLSCSPNGADLFIRQGCIGCHSFKGVGGKTGPELTAVMKRRTARWLADYLANPRKMNPQARMPSFGHLTTQEKNALVQYLQQ